jgi:starch synthase (maltosyl-transferring)
LRDLTFHSVDNDAMLAYSKSAPLPGGGRDTLIVVVNLDPHAAREATLTVDLAALGMSAGDRYVVSDAFTGASYTWGEWNYVRLDPFYQPAHLLTVHQIEAG